MLYNLIFYLDKFKVRLSLSYLFNTFTYMLLYFHLDNFEELLNGTLLVKIDRKCSISK